MDPASKRDTCEVFLSYCGDDNEPVVGEPRGWVAVFHETLERRIMAYQGRKHRPKIYFDRDRDKAGQPRIRGNDQLRRALTEALHDALVFVPIVSPSYLDSDWCEFEFGKFCELKGVESIGESSKSRIFLVIKNHTNDVKGWLEDTVAVKDLPGFHFHRDGDELDPYTNQEHVLEYKQKVSDLAKALLETLGILQHRPNTGVTIFIGNGSRDIAHQTDELARELSMPKFGHRIIRLPADQYPNPVAYRAALRSVLATCRLAIHPIGNDDGGIPAAYDVSSFVMQYQEAAAEAQRRPGEFEQLAWGLPSGAPAQERQQKFIADLEARGPRLYHKVTLQEFESRIREVLAPEPTPMQRPETAPAAPAAIPTAVASKPLVYLVCDQRDEPRRIEALVKLLKEHFTVVRSLLADEIAKMADQDGFEAEFRRDHEDYLVRCDGVVIHYGAGSQLWLRAKLRELHDAPAYGRQRPFAATAVLVADADRTDDGGYHSEDILTLDGSGEPNAEALAPFVTQMLRTIQRAV